MFEREFDLKLVEKIIADTKEEIKVLSNKSEDEVLFPEDVAGKLRHLNRKIAFWENEIELHDNTLVTQ